MSPEPKGELPTQLYKNLLQAYHGQPTTADYHARLKAARDASLEFITDSDLIKLETFARRIRGEIFFASRWLLVEGQSEYHLLHGMAKSLDYDFDEHGVAVIDFQNNGNPESFAALGRALGYPWAMLVDGDQAGTKFLNSVANRHFEAAFMSARTKQLPAGTLEQQLVADGLQSELKAILIAQGSTGAATMSDADLVAALKDDKCGYAAELGAKCAADRALTQRMPLQLRDVITILKALP